MATAKFKNIQARTSPLTAADFDTPAIREDAQRLLRLNLNRYQLKLNKHLLQQLTERFIKWLKRQQQSIAMQLQDVPKEARQKWLSERFGGDRRKPERQAARYLTDFINREVQKLASELQERKNENRAFRKSLAAARTELERREIILGYARTLGASERGLAEDRRAFDRWFDEEAVTDRYAKLVGETELALSFGLERLGYLVDHVVKTSIEEALQRDESSVDRLNRLKGLWSRLNIQSRILPVLQSECDPRLHVASLKCLRLASNSVPAELPVPIVETKTLDIVHRLALEGKSDTWLQREALTILTQISFEFAFPVLIERLQRENHSADDIFVRRHILSLIERNRDELTGLEFKPEFLIRDPSPFVRQQAARVIFLHDCNDSRAAWLSLATQDEDPSVRAAALLCIVQLEFDPLRTNQALTALTQVFNVESDEFVLRTALHVAKTLLDDLVNDLPGLEPDARQHFCDRFASEILPAIRQLECSSDSTRVRRWAAQAFELIHAINDSPTNELIQKLKPMLPQIPVGRSKRFPRSWFAGLTDHQLGRLFAVLSQEDFGFDLKRGWFGCRVTRGPQFAFRLWRFLFEFRNTATDKRQGISHCIGRISTAKTRIQSQILGELSETKVPGEPVTIADDGTWRPFLPLLDDFISVLNMSWFWRARVKFYSSQGVTTVTGPASIFKKIRAAWQLSTQFKPWADLRNWDDSSFPASQYIETLRSLGFGIEFSRYKNSMNEDSSNGDAAEKQIADESVERFFRSAGFALPLALLLSQNLLLNYFYRFVDYFSAAFENSLEELIVFAVLFLLFFCLKHFWSNYSFRKARQNIPLSIGGWGTRGKSGTERLKAALFGVLGHGVVSKTTGCEAMFIHGHAYGEPIEIPLFRPYDKATIWEQCDLIRLAARLNPSVFLWECMALNPTYVDLLQRQWMQDDLTTITNTYPDHEDVQGPAGYNVAQTISCFVPRKSVCISTEQVMRPYVTDECGRMETRFEGVGWLESGLITSDILARFPYQEHPDNIALVATMANYVGVEYDYSLKAMADYLVPDLGVLKTHPLSTVRHRKIEFTNGCSANERFGCMGNWKRLGFDSQDPWEQPCTWISGVVNNRADRVPRSKVFAKIIVHDINADRFFLIGNNLEGLKGFIDEAWDEHASEWSLRDSSEDWSNEFTVEAFKKHAWNMRQPVDAKQVAEKLSCMIESLVGPESFSLDASAMVASSDSAAQLKTQLAQQGVSESLVDTVINHFGQWQTSLQEYQQMLAKIESATAKDFEAVEDEFRALMKRWYFRKLVVVPNYFATGEDVVHTIAEETPPGFTNRVMGLQNIKGTGLDFVYRFQAWDMCHDACTMVRSKQSAQIEKGLQALIAMPEIGQLCHEHVLETVAGCRSSKDALPYSDLVDQLEQKLETSTDDSTEAKNNVNVNEPQGKTSRKLHDWICSTAEQILDVNDSVRRRDRADSIYEDLGAQRISRQRAITELRKLTKRQKGGWLVSKS